MKRWLLIVISIIFVFFVFSCAPSVPYYQKLTDEEIVERTSAVYVADLDFLYNWARIYTNTMIGRITINQIADENTKGFATGSLFDVAGNYAGSLVMVFQRLNKKKGTQDTVWVYAKPELALRTEVMAENTKDLFDYLEKITISKGGTVLKNYGGEMASRDSLRTP